MNLLITVDAFLDIYLADSELAINNNSQHNIRQAVDFSLKIDSALTANKEGDIALILTTKKTSSPHPHPPSSLLLVFSNEDQREEFL